MLLTFVLEWGTKRWWVRAGDPCNRLFRYDSLLLSSFVVVSLVSIPLLALVFVPYIWSCIACSNWTRIVGGVNNNPRENRSSAPKQREVFPCTRKAEPAAVPFRSEQIAYYLAHNVFTANSPCLAIPMSVRTPIDYPPRPHQHCS